MNVTILTCCTLLFMLMTPTTCAAFRKLSLWIDERQVQKVVGLSKTFPFPLYIIHRGNVTEYLNENGFDASLPILPYEIDAVNLMWEAGDEQFTYWFDNLKSRNKTILYNPLLNIPASGIVPKEAKIFQISIPCTGIEEGVAHLILGLQILDQHEKPIKGSPIKLKLKKQCLRFGTDRKRRSKHKKNVERLKVGKRKKKCAHIQTEIKNRCNEEKKCKSKKDRISKQCLNKNDTPSKKRRVRQAKIARRCVKQKKRRMTRCDRKQLALKKTCSGKKQ